jgi:hypothetical protein
VLVLGLDATAELELLVDELPHADTASARSAKINPKASRVRARG